MEYDKLFDIENDRFGPPGHDTAALGPSDSSDSGSDVVGLFAGDIALAGEAAAGLDIAPDRIVGQPDGPDLDDGSAESAPDEGSGSTRNDFDEESVEDELDEEDDEDEADVEAIPDRGREPGDGPRRGDHGRQRGIE